MAFLSRRFPGADSRRVFFRTVRTLPLDDLDAVAVRVVDEEAVGAGDRCRFLRGNAKLAEVGPGAGGVCDAQREVTGAAGVGPVLEQQVQVLIAQVEPDDHEVESPRLVDLLQAEYVMIKAPAALDVGDNHGTMVDLLDLKR